MKKITKLDKISDLAIENELAQLKFIIKETFWMARRYAHGRHTGSPSTIRDCYRILKERFPELVPFKDVYISETTGEPHTGFNLKEDWLNDCNEERGDE